MAKKYDHIPEKQLKFIKEQKLFFVATAATDSKINLSPKGTDSLRILHKKRIVWLNLTGSGNETAAHLLENNRITLMFCAFEGDPLILRVYGRAKSHHPRDITYQKLIELFPKTVGARQIIDIEVEMVQTSCGFAVPFFEFKKERTQLTEWAEDKNENDFEIYWRKKKQHKLRWQSYGHIILVLSK